MLLDLPKPKFAIHQRVWRATAHKVRKAHDCPDCLGQRRWTVTTPGGSTFSTACQRCSNENLPRGVPPLVYLEEEPATVALTIGSIRIDTASERSPIEYMAVETGVGSGSVYYERDLFEDEASAMRAAQARVSLENTAQAATPERVQKLIYSSMTLDDAALKAADSAVWSSWEAYRWLREDLQQLVAGGPTDLHEALSDALQTEEWRDESRPHPLQRLREIIADYAKVSRDAGMPALDLEEALAAITPVRPSHGPDGGASSPSTTSSADTPHD